ncbi:MAG: hypothetical protein WC592_02625 [Candidatus Omnitrophota bacterium]
MEEKNLNETIKEAVTAESRKDSWLETLGISWEDVIKALEQSEKDEKYLTELAKKTASNKSRHFIVVRSIVLDIHLLLDYTVSSVIGFMLVFRGGHHGKEYNGQEVQEIIDFIHDKVDYAKRVHIIERLKIFSKDAIKILYAVNNLRVAFAHGKKNVEYNYFNKSVFDKNTIDRLQADKNKVLGEYSEFLKNSTDKKT